MDGVARVGGQDDVARAERGQGEVAQTFFRADGHYDLVHRIEGHAVVTGIPAHDGVLDHAQAGGRLVAVVLTLARGFAQRLHGEGRGGQIGVAEAKVVDHAPLRAQLFLLLVDRAEDVGGEAGHAGKIGVGHGASVGPRRRGVKE